MKPVTTTKLNKDPKWIKMDRLHFFDTYSVINGGYYVEHSIWIHPLVSWARSWSIKEMASMTEVFRETNFDLQPPWETQEQTWLYSPPDMSKIFHWYQRGGDFLMDNLTDYYKLPVQ